ncbi:MAG: hypothetical protein KAH86_07060 [Methanosarcinales archaeon]|nr:hypothetical protein [Methanosarcinales archaeon]
MCKKHNCPTKVRSTAGGRVLPRRNSACEVFNNLKTKYGVMETHTDHNKVWLYKDEYDDLFEYIDRLKETIDFLSDKNAVAEVKTALTNIASGDYLTKEDMVFD